MNERVKKPAKNWVLPTIIMVALILAIVGTTLWSKAKSEKSKTVKIGVITDLTGPAAYWGGSSRVGAEMAEKELEAEGYNVDLVFEDYQLDAAKALSGAQKLVDIDNVDAIYAEFNPAAYSINPYINDKNKIFVYDAAAVSPLEVNGDAYKTYLNYQAGNRLVAEKFRNQGIDKIGVLKMNLEPGELGLLGAKEVFGDNTIVESYDIGTTDLKTQVLKLKNAGAGAIINVAAFEGDTLNTLKAMRELNFKAPYGTVDDSITGTVKSQYSDELKGAVTFGFANVDTQFSTKLKSTSDKELATEYGAAITYTHIKQMVKALAASDGDITKANKKLASSPADKTIGFKKFTNRIAELDMTIKEY